MQYLFKNEYRKSLGHGPFRIHRVFPGLPLELADDAGLGALGMFDHAELSPGLLVRMHEHRNDEIFSYVDSGSLYHTDSHGSGFPITPNEPLMMNAGSGLSHEETIPEDGEPVEMLQVFVRPPEPNMKPILQHHPLTMAVDAERWRPLFGPDDKSPFTVRNQVWMSDRMIHANEQIEIETHARQAAFIYLFKGSISWDDETLRKGDAILMVEENGPLMLGGVEESSLLVRFDVDLNASYSRAGTLSG